MACRKRVLSIRAVRGTSTPFSAYDLLARELVGVRDFRGLLTKNLFAESANASADSGTIRASFQCSVRRREDAAGVCFLGKSRAVGI